MSKGNQTLYALKILKAHGLTGLDTVNRATLLPSILYASPGWWGFVSNKDQATLQDVINKAGLLGLYQSRLHSLQHLCDKADRSLFKFKMILNNDTHVLHHYNPLKPLIHIRLEIGGYRPHNRC